MLSITECKRILNRGGVFYSKEEIGTIRTILYQLAEMQLSHNNIKY